MEMAMTIPIIAQVAVDVLSAIFALAGLVNLSGSTRLRVVHRLWHYPHNFYRIVGLAQLMAALFLIVPETRIWGIVAGGTIIFVVTVTLLHHRQYLWSLPVMLLLVSLVPASLARS
jgi:DoxX-like family